MPGRYPVGGSPDGDLLLRELLHGQRDFISTRETRQLFGCDAGCVIMENGRFHQPIDLKRDAMIKALRLLRSRR